MSENLLQPEGVVRVSLVGSRLNQQVVAQCGDTAAVDAASQNRFGPVLVEPGRPVQFFEFRVGEMIRFGERQWYYARQSR